MTENTILEELIAMARTLGDPVNDYAILGEGNASARVDDKTFWVKASGTQLGKATADSFTQIYFEPVLAMVEKESLSDEEVKEGLDAAKVDSSMRKPSIETFLHALALSIDGVNFVGHTHATAVNIITCSAAFETAVSGRIFPDEIIVCGVAPVVIPYADPGITLAHAVRDGIYNYMDEYGETPKMILMQNHGVIALGRTSEQVCNIMAMAVKWARILAGTYALGGPHFMTPENVARIHTRPDEAVRRKLLGE